MKIKYSVFMTLVISCVLCLCGCSSEGSGVPESVIREELGAAVTEADSFKISHNVDKSAHIDTVTVTATYENEFCKSKGTGTYQYRYYKSNDMWEKNSQGTWEWNSHLKDFTKIKNSTRIVTVTDMRGNPVSEDQNVDERYCCLEIAKDSIDTENNTFECTYYVECNRYNEALGYYQCEYSYSSEGYVTVEAVIIGGGGVFVDLKDPNSSESDRIWLTKEKYVDIELFL